MTYLKCLISLVAISSCSRNQIGLIKRTLFILFNRIIDHTSVELVDKVDCRGLANPGLFRVQDLEIKHPQELIIPH